MTAAHDTSACRHFERWLTAYIDEELDAVHCLEVEDHLDDCADCREVIVHLRATRASLRRVMCVKAPSGLRERMAELLAVPTCDESSETASVEDSADSDPAAKDEDAEPRDGEADEPRKSGVYVRLRHLVPLAAAATVALVVGAAQLSSQETAPAAVADADGPRRVVADVEAPTQVATLDHFAEDLVLQHVHPPPVEVTDPGDLQRFDPYIGVRARAPRFEEIEARYVGARMHQRAALLRYILDNDQAVTMAVFDPKRIDMQCERLKARHYGNGDVYVGKVRGYSVAASTRNGVGYAVASDLSDDEAAELVLMAAK